MRVITITGLILATTALFGCGTEKPEPMASVEVTDYKALGTEPFWSVTIKDKVISYDSPDDSIDFSVPLTKIMPMKTGWEARGFDDTKNIALTVVKGQECSDGMSDRKYADTVTARVALVGNLKGCGGEITGGDEAP